MRSMQAASASAYAAAPASRAQEMERISAESSVQYECLQRVLREDSADADMALGRLDADVARYDLLAMPAAQGAAGQQGAVAADADATMHELLQDLKVEPVEQSEVAAKFSLFEKYLETVVDIRKELFAFWANARSDFPDGACHTIEAEMKAIDREENTGLADGDQYWFVHGMTLKASANNKIISRTLALIKTRLDLLGQQEDCPVCFEVFSSERPPTTLGCCHKVCAECWAHWTAMRHGAAFCPLCRHDEFLDNVLSGSTL